MKKLAVLLGLSGAFLAAQADMTRTFDKDLVDDCNEDLGQCMIFEYPEDAGTNFVAATGVGTGNVLRKTFSLEGKYASAGVGVVFDQGWLPVDASALTGVKITLRTDVERPITVSLKNSEDPDYDALGVEGLGYMTTVADVTPEGTTVTLLPTKFVFPSWWNSGTGNAAAIAWIGGKTKTLMDAKRADVLKSLTAIQVAVNCDSCVESGWFEVDDVTLVSVTDAEGYGWIEGEPVASVLPRSANIQGLRTAINGQSLLVGRGESSAATLDLIRLDGSKVASWSISGSNASVALPTGLEKGTYYAVVSSEGKRSSSTVSIVR